MAKPETNTAPETKLDLRIEKLVYGGEGLARREGRVVFVPYTLPGERVIAAAAPGKGDLLRATPLQVLEPAAGRVAPPCPYFARCGGCHYQHAAYELQLEVKRAILRETLLRTGKIEAPEQIHTLAGEPWAYRNRAQFHVSGRNIGYREARSHRLCAVTKCPISSPRLNEALAALNAMARDIHWPLFLRSLEVFTNETETQINVLESDRPVARRFFEWCAGAIPGFTPGLLDYPAAGFTFRIGSGSFFQVNRFLIDALAQAATAGASGDWALDLYAGAGLFSLPLSRRFAKVTAVESGASAVRDLQFNAERAGASLQIEHSSTEAYLEKLGQTPDFVLADPPRAGLGKAAVSRLAALKPRRITIVACDPATLARDLPGLLDAGYRLERLTMADLFPQTFHLETIAELVNFG